MEFREVEKTIKGCLGGDFTGKVVVRIIEGKIIACDVGSTKAPMPWLSNADFMKCVIPQSSGPHWRDFLTQEERQEIEQAEAALAEAKQLVETRDKAWAEAERAWRRAERARYTADEQSINKTAASGFTSLGAPRRDTDDLRAASEEARRAWLEAKDIQGEAMIAKSKIDQRLYARGRRRMQAAEAAPEAKPETLETTSENWLRKLKAAAKRL